jgi:hypothetical protein
VFMGGSAPGANGGGDLKPPVPPVQ